MTLRKLTLASVTAAAMCAPMLASADSDLQVGAPGATSAVAHLDFRISIPTYIYFQIGSAAIVDTVDFDLTAGPTTPGTGPLAATSGPVTVVLRTNATTLNLSATGADLIDGAGNTILLSDITGTAAGTGDIPHPTFNGGSVAVSPVTSDIVTDNIETWTFSYANAAAVPAGVYGDGAGNGSQVTYTIADF